MCCAWATKAAETVEGPPLEVLTFFPPMTHLCVALGLPNSADHMVKGLRPFKRRRSPAVSVANVVATSAISAYGVYAVVVGLVFQFAVARFGYTSKVK